MSNLRHEGDLIIHPDVEPVPKALGGGAWRVTGHCPGEYCKYGNWKLRRGVVVRHEPRVDADSIGFVPPERNISADSGFVVVGPPGLVLVTGRPRGLDFAVYLPSFTLGDTVIVLNDLSEGYWNVIWRKCLTISYGYWDSAGVNGARLLRKARRRWWVHVTDGSSGTKGWVLMDGISFLPE